MKRTLILMICAVLALCLTGCGGEPAPGPTPSQELNLETLAPVLTTEEVMEASAADAEARAAEEPASDTDVEIDEDAFAAAKACIGMTIEELYAAVGEPAGGTSYAASCLEEDAEDGMLFYTSQGFYVWTVRNADGETVHAVYPLD